MNIFSTVLATHPSKQTWLTTCTVLGNKFQMVAARAQAVYSTAIGTSEGPHVCTARSCTRAFTRMLTRICMTLSVDHRCTS